jgi:hypothetical protein
MSFEEAKRVDLGESTRDTTNGIMRTCVRQRAAAPWLATFTAACLLGACLRPDLSD